MKREEKYTSLTVMRPTFVSKLEGIASCVSMEEKVEFVRDENTMRLISKRKLEGVRFQFGNNYGNKIYTDRETGNKLYKALLDKTVIAECEWDLWKAAAAFLESIGAQFEIHI